ncbi:MAG: hypothetical protein SGJ27_12670 [Candidatus Melainabacteria bacterium]|nr:hypothetical protein [Candidatus Melainabacteria bacterium]
MAAAGKEVRLPYTAVYARLGVMTPEDRFVISVIWLTTILSITLMVLGIVNIDMHVRASFDSNRPWVLVFLLGALLGFFPLVKAKIGTWSKVAIVSALFTVLEAYGLNQSDHGLATNRAWVSPCIWGFLLALSSIFPFVGMLLAGRGFDRAFRVVLYFVVAGSSPTIAAAIFTAPRWIH